LRPTVDNLDLCLFTNSTLNSTPDHVRVMAFFGLTALGNQDPFASQSKQYATLNIFTIDDFRAGFNKVSGGDGSK
jgi:hypothetical protein